MKNVILFSSLLLLLSLSCNKDKEDDGLYWGEMTAIKNNNSWNAELYATNNLPHSQGFDILFDGFDDNGSLVENLYIYKIPLAVGIYNLDSTSVRDIDTLVGSQYFTLLEDGHVAGDSYMLLTNDTIPDFVEITKIDGNEIWGKTQVSFVKDLRFGEGDPSAPDTVIFRNGNFHTKLTD